ncbi:MAG: ribosomal-protein-alanine N-acetyltransferase [Deltaproteobacteria bacterium CG11_big_fil_rev_8_21_14_0_20_49_13]|nr:MAG: ribosomal-protein-alanine N-acetyltransferase [Deltaproteobacteria bacterium CG11_big_fil_rev_8_21_14_0_20_49_13]
MTVNVRPVVPDDVERISYIEDRSFSAPFSKEMYQTMVKASPPFYGMVAVEDNEPVGYLFYSIGADEMELLTIAVDESFRQRGIAKAMLDEMIDLAGRSSVISIFLEVRPSNVAALLLYKSFGFEQIGVRKGYYKDNNEDALTMKKCLHLV